MEETSDIDVVDKVRGEVIVDDFLDIFELSHSGVPGNTQDHRLGSVEKGSHLL